MIEVTNIVKNYGNLRVLNGLNLQFRDGEVTCLLGPNGAGKSTLLSIIAGLLQPNSGTVCVDGAKLRDSSNPLREISAVLDHDSAHPARSAISHLRWISQTVGMPRSRADAMLNLVGLNSVAHNRVKSFSLGMRQRLAVAGALVPDAHNLIFDEPVNGLDVDGIIWMRQLFRHLADEGCTVILSSHLISEVEKIADRVIIIGAGGVLADGTVAELCEEYDGLEQVYVSLTRDAVAYGKAVATC